MRISSFVIFSLVLISWSCLGATKITKLNQKLDDQRAKVYKFAAEIKHLEKKLGETNNTYLEKVELIEKLEKKIQVFQVDLEKSASSISRDYLNSKKALNLYLLEATDESNQDQIHHKKIYLEILSKNLKEYEQAQSKSNKLLEMINLYEQKLTQTRASEEEVYNLIVEMENRKKEMSQTYINQLESKNELEAQLDKYRAKQKAYKKVYPKKSKSKKIDKSILAMQLPIKNFSGVTKSKKGLSFKFKEMTDVLAPSAGKVAYAGELASYGNVIIIDHGRGIKSVLLGDMKIKARKGDVVKEAQVLAYTLTEPGIQKSLYYEIRKKDIVQNTLQWISKNNKNNLVL
ncbi:MAG: hypothetical protein CME62_10680 [Halobacteriovoraceae bacterium]|nr:hypothetical protein [Halobacteriovoraceae bacterium]|tara:strand:- start:18331 stop:19365 length:1035 start_codon:yes stop_codon:yes gene_type:complete